MYDLKQNKALQYLKSLALLGFFVIFIVFSGSGLYGARRGLIYSLEILIPSMFVFIFFANFASSSSLLKPLNQVLSKATRVLFGLPGQAAIPILISMVGGYPSGASAVNVLVKKGEITLKEAQKMLLFCINSGLGFTINVVGQSILKSHKFGIILFICQVLSSLILGIAINLFSKKEKCHHPLKSNLSEFKRQDGSKIELKKGTTSQESFSHSFVESTLSTVKIMAGICGFVILFSSILEVLKHLGISSVFVSLFLEITNGVIAASNLHISVFVLAFFICFSGICVHLQIFSIVKGISFSKVKFLFFRVLHGVLTSTICYMAFGFLKISTQSFCASTVGKGPGYSLFSYSHSGFYVVFLCICFLFAISDVQEFCKESN